MTHITKHTPGPWAVEGDNNGYMIVGPGQCYIADICASDGLVNENDAALIAAAPAMYEALAKLRLEAIHYRNTGVGKQFLNEAIAQAEQAINQVWGEGNHDTKREG